MNTQQCKHCHKVKPLSDFPKEPRMTIGYKSTCKQCRNEKRVEKYHSIPEYREKRKAYSRQYARDNKEWNTEHVKEWAKKNHEHVIERAKRYWHERVDKIKYNARRSLKRRERYKTDPIFRAKRKKDGHHAAKIYKARMRGIEGTYSQKEWKELCDKYDNRCLCCGKKKPLTVDHVVPLSKGGSNSIDNIQCLCLECNCSKGTKTIDYRGGQ